MFWIRLGTFLLCLFTYLSYSTFRSSPFSYNSGIAPETTAYAVLCYLKHWLRASMVDLAPPRTKLLFAGGIRRVGYGIVKRGWDGVGMLCPRCGMFDRLYRYLNHLAAPSVLTLKKVIVTTLILIDGRVVRHTLIVETFLLPQELT